MLDLVPEGRHELNGACPMRDGIGSCHVVDKFFQQCSQKCIELAPSEEALISVIKRMDLAPSKKAFTLIVE